MDTPSYAQNTITEYSIQPTKLYGDFGGSARYDLLTVVMICLGDPDKGFPIDQTTYSKLLKLLSMVSSHKVSVDQKLAMLEQEYHIATTRKLEEGFNTMCNWSEAIIERIRRDVVNEVTNEATQKSNERAIINIMSSLECSFEKACEILKLDPTDYASLKERLIDTTI